MTRFLITLKTTYRSEILFAYKKKKGKKTWNLAALPMEVETRKRRNLNLAKWSVRRTSNPRIAMPTSPALITSLPLAGNFCWSGVSSSTPQPRLLIGQLFSLFSSIRIVFRPFFSVHSLFLVILNLSPVRFAVCGKRDSKPL